MWKLLILLFVAAVHAGYYEELTAKQIPEIMKKTPKWVAGHNPFLAGKSADELKQLLGGKVDKNHKVPQKTFPEVGASIPASFDARSQWPKCTLIPFIRDQGQCGSCWAVASTSVMSDRYCIQSNGAEQPYISDEDVLSCCGSFCGSGCGGGYPYNAFSWWASHGVCSGGIYDSRQGCKPYAVPPSDYISFNGKTPSCTSTCESGFTTSYQNDKHSGSAYYQVGNGVTGMQQEVMTNGPVATVFNVYSDFYNYQSGIYEYTYGSYEGGHVVRIIGWGEDNNTPYWLVANSWNSSWGMGGFFKMIRGNNDCGFESNVYAGTAKL